MTLNERRGHWQAGHKDAALLQRRKEIDATEQPYQCFTVKQHAVEWLAEQVAERTIADVGGFEAVADWEDWLNRQGTGDEEADAEQLHARGEHRFISADIGDIEYRMQVCTCTGDVTGRCDNPGCDRDTDWDSEPSPGVHYTRWLDHCHRCGYGTTANGGFIGRYETRVGGVLTSRAPVPNHKHVPGTHGSVSKLIEDDEWTGWRCRETVAEDGTECGVLWRFTNADEWASQYRLTRMWDGKVTGTEGYAITEAEAIEQQAEMNAQPWRADGHCTVGIEKIEHKEAQQ